MSSFDPTARVSFGRTGLSVSRLGLGTAPLATEWWGNDEDTAIAAVERALEHGITLFDTAPLYGSGESEQRLGRVLAGVDRDSVVVTTKVGRLLVPDATGALGPEFDFSADAVRRSLDSSLVRMGLDRIDVVHVHDPEDHLDQALTEAIPALCTLRDEGVITAVSVGTNVVDTGLRFLADADIDAMLVAGRLTLLNRSAAAELVPACAAAGVAYIAAGVFNSGVLARPQVEGAWYDYSPASDEIQGRVAGLQALCESFGVSLQAVAMAFPSTVAGVTTTVVGMASPTEVDENLGSAHVDIPDQLWSELPT